jgi:2-iminobutanoate/2-iminopropanoate deaminase
MTDPKIESIIAPAAPPAIGPYAHAVKCSGTMLYLSGQIALRPDGSMVEGDVDAQTRQVMVNICAILATQGATLENVVKSTVFLASMNDFAGMNAVYAEAFGAHRPARSAFEVARLPKDALVEIEVVAVL